MPVWDKIGRAAWAGAKGGRKLRGAAAAAEAGGDGADGDDHGDGTAGPLELELPTEEGVLLVRYLTARSVMAWLEPLFLVKYAVLVLAAVVAVVTRWWWLVALLGVVFLVLFAIERLVGGRVRRFGLLRELEELETIGGDALVAWWPNLRRELRRVGLPLTPWGLAKAGVASRRRAEGDGVAARFRQIEWGAVVPHAEWRRARALLGTVAASRRT
ncbi:MAG TPA: hypothetical protein VIL36_03930 [Acidimicrobiales bacterium]